MPTGAKLPKSESEIGAVRLCAAKEALKLEDNLSGITLTNRR